jgi:rubrerythrin
MDPLAWSRKEASMTDEVRGVGGEKPDPEARGDTEAMNWACTVCGYRVEGELPEKCPDCGADRENFDHVPVPGY